MSDIFPLLFSLFYTRILKIFMSGKFPAQKSRL